MLFCKFDNVSGIDTSFWRIIFTAVDSENVFKFNFRFHELVEERYGFSRVFLLGFAQTAESGNEIGMHRLRALLSAGPSRRYGVWSG